MKKALSTIKLLIVVIFLYSQHCLAQIQINDSWEFTLEEENQNPTHLKWNLVDLPHDWSVDTNLFPSIFTRESEGKIATGHVHGGIGWYQKSIQLNNNDKDKEIYLYFEGIYMESEIYVNNKKVDYNPYGYISFHCNITKQCYFNGNENIIKVKVKNEGKNSRWYSGSGIYRNVWLVKQNKIHIKPLGIAVTTPEITKSEAKINISLDINNALKKNLNGLIKIDILDQNKNIIASSETKTNFTKTGNTFSKEITIQNPNFWDIISPYLYTARISLLSDNIVIDEKEQHFGVRSISFDADKGFQLNGHTIKLKGGCIHHDNGLLGAKAIDRAEERKIELLLANGFNAIRTAHNPPSEKLLEACDRLGMLVIDESFDQWTQAKNPQDYHRFFDKYAERDVALMVLRDRNHPSVIMWSIGNEIPERARENGVKLAQQLKNTVLRYDQTRPITAAVNEFWDNPDMTWKNSEAAFSNLDVAGYNYMHWEYENDHKLFPSRVMYGSESVAKEANINWDYVEKHSYLIGDFVWTAIDYLGESGIGHAYNVPKDSNDRIQFLDWPWYNGFCGDIDLCGNKKPQGYYRDILWGERAVSISTSKPLPEDMKEKVSYWGWKQEDKTWNYNEYKEQPIPVNVYTRGDKVELYLNNRLVGQKECSQQTAYTASFEIPFESGTLKTIAYKNDIIIGTDYLRTPTENHQIILTADRNIINASKKDLSFINVEIKDENGTLINTNEVKLTINCKGVGKIIASGNAAPDDMGSFNSLTPKTYNGRAQIIIQPTGEKGIVELSVSSTSELASKSLIIECK